EHDQAGVLAGEGLPADHQADRQGGHPDHLRLADPGRGELAGQPQEDAAQRVARRLMAAKPAAKPAPKSRPAPKVAFPKKSTPPTDAEFGARLPAAVGKSLEAVRAYLDTQEATEEFYYYGPR